MNTANVPETSNLDPMEGSRNLDLDELMQRAVGLHQNHQFDAAARLYEEILVRSPRHFDAMHLLGVLHSQNGNPGDAARLIGAALEIQENPAAFLNLGLALSDLGNLANALDSYDRAVALSPNYPEAYNNRGTVLTLLKRNEEALADFDNAIALRPAFPEAFNNRGNVLRELKRSEEAVASFDQAISSKPNYVSALKNRIVALTDLDRFEEALLNCDEVLATQPDDWEAFYTRGNILGNLHRIDEALACYDQAIALCTGNTTTAGSSDNAPGKAEHHESSLNSNTLEDARQPTVADIYWNQGLLHLLKGDFEKGWRGYEWRWRKTGHRPVARNFTQPLWSGIENLSGKTILLHAEQGLGDAIQFARYVPHVAKRGGRVVLEVHAALAKLFRNMDYVADIIVAGSPLPRFDCHCPLLSLPLAFATRVDSIPASIPFLEASPEKILQWSHRLKKMGRGALRIGIAWSGNPTHANDRYRSMPLATLLKAIPPGIKIFSLQKDIRPEDSETLRANRHLVNFGDMLDDFNDTAAIISLLDIVITVDTSVAHLAGALGAQTWLLLPFIHDWRWLVGRDDSPWYPTMRLFRQPALNDWDTVVDSVRAALLHKSEFRG